MFTQARLKLTFWYVLMIMVVSVLFSLIIFQVTTFEIQRFARAQRLQLLQQMRGDNLYPDRFRFDLPPLPLLDPEVIEQTQQRVIRALGLLNLGILIASTGLSFFLAGKTLRPIKDMVDEQNRFISDASHELRTPLTALRANMEVSLRDKKFTIAQAKRLIVDSITDVTKLQKLSDDMLTLARVEKKPAMKDMEYCELKELGEEVAKKMTPLAKKRSIEISVDADKGWVWGVRTQLIQLLIILTDNAIKYAFSPSVVTIHLKIAKRSIRFEIENKGVGIAKKDLDKIWERFFRADPARTNKESGGYGLGLAIAQKIVNTHRGSIRAFSEENGLTVFRVDLPKG